MAGRARGRTSAVHRNGEPGAASSLRTGTCSGSQRGRPEDTAVRRLATDQGRAVNTSHTHCPARTGRVSRCVGSNEPTVRLLTSLLKGVAERSARRTRTLSDQVAMRAGSYPPSRALHLSSCAGSGSDSYRPGIAESPWAAASTRSPVTPYTSS